VDNRLDTNHATVNQQKKERRKKTMRQCPKCGYEESPCWKRSFQGNPNGDIDVARIDSLKDWEPELANMTERNRGKVVKDGIYVYYLGRRAIWVKKVLARLYKEGGMSVFNVPHESGKPKRTQHTKNIKEQ